MSEEIKTAIDQRNVEAEKRIDTLSLKAKRHTRFYETAIIYKNLSIIPNAISILAAFFGAYFLTDGMAPFGRGLIIFMACLLLPTIEFLKRLLLGFIGNGKYDADESVVPAHVVFLVLVVAISVGVSGFGGDKATEYFSPIPPMAADPSIDSMRAEIVKLEDDNKLQEKQTWRGRIVEDALEIKLRNTELIGLIRTEISLKEGSNNKDYAELVANHKKQTMQLGFVIGGTAGLMDILLIILFLGYKKNIQTAIQLKNRSTSPTPAAGSKSGLNGGLKNGLKVDQLKNGLNNKVDGNGLNGGQPVEWGFKAIELRKEGWTLQQIGDHFGVTPQAVSKKLKKLNNVRQIRKQA